MNTPWKYTDDLDLFRQGVVSAAYRDADDNWMFTAAVGVKSILRTPLSEKFLFDHIACAPTYAFAVALLRRQSPKLLSEVEGILDRTDHAKWVMNSPALTVKRRTIHTGGSPIDIMHAATDAEAMEIRLTMVEQTKHHYGILEHIRNMVSTRGSERYLDMTGDTDALVRASLAQIEELAKQKRLASV